jgi:hypothetical protein
MFLAIYPVPAVNTLEAIFLTLFHHL